MKLPSIPTDGIKFICHDGKIILLRTLDKGPSVEGDDMISRKLIIQRIAFGASVIVAIQIGIILIKGSSVCPNAACKIVEDLTTITPLGVNIVGFLYFQSLFWALRRQANRENGAIYWINLLLLAGLAAETVLFAFQFFVVHAFCTYCLFIFAIILIMNLLCGNNHLWSGVAIMAAILIGFSALRFNPAVASSPELSLEKGIYGTRTCINPSKQIYLVFSEDCPHCIKVIDALEGCSSCELHLNPIDRIVDLKSPDLELNPAFSPKVNRSMLSMFGIGEIPVLLVDNQDGFQFIKGTQRIIEYISHACFVQEPTLVFDRSQFKDREHITAFSLDEGECSVEIDCSGLEDP